MKRRSFLGLLGLAPAVPLAAKHLPDLTPPAPKELTPAVADAVHYKTPTVYGSPIYCSMSYDTSATYVYQTHATYRREKWSK